ncbi:MAG TPA: tyrosine-protein phosphatase [Paenirhodobacter sp.]
MTRTINLNGVANLRDLGDLPLAGVGDLTRRGRLLRSDSLHKLDAVGQAYLRDLGLMTVIDLRATSEAIRAPNPFAADTRIGYHNISLFEGILPRADTPDVLADMYWRALLERTAAFAQVMTVIAQAPAGAVLFHCAAGKDRTGMTAAMLLALAGVGEDAIVADYALTAERLAPIRQTLISLAEAEGYTAQAFVPLLACAPETMTATLQALRARFGSVADYLVMAGVGRQALHRLTGRLTA